MLHNMANNQDITEFPNFVGSSIDVEITQYDRKWFERFRSYKFLYIFRITIDGGADSTLFVNELLNVHQDALERVFVAAIQTILDEFNYSILEMRIDRVVQPDFVQVGLEHQDFVDYIYSSRLVKYGEFKLNEVAGRIMNWLQNLAQSNKKINTINTWTLTLDILRTTMYPEV